MSELNSKVKELPVFARCPKCGEQVLAHRLKKHLKKVHSPEQEQKRMLIKVEERIAKERAEHERNELVRCCVCMAELKSKSLAKHMKKVHGLSSAQLLSNKTNRNNPKPPLPSVINASARTETKDFESENFNGKGIFVSGGAVGLGKRR